MEEREVCLGRGGGGERERGTCKSRLVCIWGGGGGG